VRRDARPESVLQALVIIGDYTNSYEQSVACANGLRGDTQIPNSGSKDATDPAACLPLSADTPPRVTATGIIRAWFNLQAEE
jgi:hypothetical protein